ncbi:MAG: RluA family pseudouridine synthase [Chlamydiales bacterium]|nr:RluA family pseudouridine synthase [Chlamydiales bacterium]
MDIETIIVTDSESNIRLDKLLALRFPTFSRNYFQTLILQGFVLLNGIKPKKRLHLTPDDEIEICFQLTPEIDVKPQNIPLDILFEDEHLLAINKPAGMVVHPAPGHPSGTFANALLHHCKGLETPGDPLRPGIVHRLDKETSGVLLAAKTSQTHGALVELFASRSIQKTYLAITTGSPGNCTIDAPIGRHPVHRKQMTTRDDGKQAITHFRVLANDGPLHLIECRPETGRTHQIRVHLKSCNAPVLGDKLYAKPNPKIPRHLLHAWKLQLIHPITKKNLTIEAPCHELDFLVPSICNKLTPSPGLNYERIY